MVLMLLTLFIVFVFLVCGLVMDDGFVVSYCCLVDFVFLIGVCFACLVGLGLLAIAGFIVVLFVLGLVW